jgi:hypothetical protein
VPVAAALTIPPDTCQSLPLFQVVSSFLFEFPVVVRFFRALAALRQYAVSRIQLADTASPVPAISREPYLFATVVIRWTE